MVAASFGTNQRDNVVNLGHPWAHYS